MKIVFKLYATLQDYMPMQARKSNAMTLELAEGITISQIIERLGLPRKLCHLVLVDGTFVPPEARDSRALKEAETLAIWPPVAGG